MPICVRCGAETPADEGAMTGDGLICRGCEDQQRLALQERRAAIEARMNAGAGENAFGDATFSPKKRKAAALLVVLTFLLLLVLYALRLGRVL